MKCASLVATLLAACLVAAQPVAAAPAVAVSPQEFDLAATRAAAQAGDARKMGELGAALVLGVGIDKDEAQGVAWLRIGNSIAPARPDDLAATHQNGVSAAARPCQRWPSGPPRHSPRGSSGLDLRPRSQG